MEEITQKPKKQLTAAQIAEQSIITTYRKTIWRPFVKAILEFELINDGDNIAVCMSGGKDSMLLAKCMQELKAHGKNNFNLKFLVMDPGYDEEYLQKIKYNAQLLNIPVTIMPANIFDYVTNLDKGSPCYLCARMRRGNLYAFAKEMGCNKIALGHHFNDVIETTLMSMLYNGKFKTMMPKLKSKNFEGMELIRPLYHVKEQDIINWRNHNKLEFINCGCKLTKACTIEPTDKFTSKRREMKMIVKKLKEINPDFDNNIFTSLYDVNVNTVLSYEQNNKKVGLNDWYKQSTGNDDEQA